MVQGRKSILWDISREEIFDIANKFKSINGMLQYFGLSGSAFYTLKTRLLNEQFDFSLFNKNTLKKKHNPKKSIVDYMVENSSYGRGSLKARIIREKIILYKCNMCGCDPIWRNNSLVLILDHINGVRNDHRKENLQFLCPNCNSQTPTFAGRNNNKEKNIKVKYCPCGKKIYFKSTKCIECLSMESRKVIWPSAQELGKMLWEKPTSQIAKEFGVSDQAVTKWAKKYGLTKPQRGYWNKIYGERSVREA
jgi:predicted RNA-binding Zn-ribbon protein involved in translation (DUF1610 family)